MSRFGNNKEKKRIHPRPTNITLFEAPQNVPIEPNVEGFGFVNYRRK